MNRTGLDRADDAVGVAVPAPDRSEGEPLAVSEHPVVGSVGGSRRRFLGVRIGRGLAGLLDPGVTAGIGQRAGDGLAVVWADAV
ncbi:hypothetical protein C487_01625 [Natrinema pallidum DSM 3751]|uniref:Uncharacterized protein n=1 Tax=Natrinema pallidum DSM 3751 TaxID=1227495 RepID=L9Z8A1_9EURY|nr:hypothetical protein C487_01625 [Natrinema pallidum DSM 3751]